MNDFNIEVNKLNSLEELERLRNTILSKNRKDIYKILICHGTGCVANGSDQLLTFMKDILKRKNIDAEIFPMIKKTGCHGFCSRGPLVIIQPMNFLYQRVTPKDIEEIVDETILKGKAIKRLLYKDKHNNSFPRVEDIPFYKLQTRLVLRNVGNIDPTNINDSIALGSYKALAKVLFQMSNKDVINEIKKSGLRGRGGAGFPTGIKWESAWMASKEIERNTTYVIVNGDEGDPGAFMDRTIMEGDPHAILEGLIIGAYALKSKVGYIYVREEYPIAIKHLKIAIEQAKSLGLIGENILNSNFSFDVKINRGAGAFVCGESTALFKSIEGNTGTPKPKYIRSVKEGLWGKPTVLNNVETWANIPLIISNGSSWFSKIGLSTNTGTKVFSLVGNVNNVGLVEVPMGIRLCDIVEEIGGGTTDEKPFKAIQTGGPSGGCIPYSLKNVSVDFDSLSEKGSMMGSGGLIVMDHHHCVVDVSYYFLKFLEEESCGKCFPCRLGIKRLKSILNKFRIGTACLNDINIIKELSKVLQDGSLCALGSSAPNPLLTTIQYFEDEYIQHINGICPAGVCKSLISFYINENLCKGCGLCKAQCPKDCITGKVKEPHSIILDKCIRCGACLEVCNFNAIMTK